MKPRSYSSEGIVLARRNFSEADRILVVFSKSYGKLSLIAKGVRKPKSRKRGALEIFSQIKFSAARGKNLDIMTEVEIIENFSKVRKDLKKVAVAYYLMEVAGKITKDDEKNEHLYKIILNYLKQLRSSVNLKKLRKDYVYLILTTQGYWPKGRVMDNPDAILAEVIERELNSIRVGKKLLT